MRLASPTRSGRSTDAFVVAFAELLHERRLATKDAAQLIQRTESETRAVLARMVESGTIEARGDGRARSYHLSAAVYRAIGAAGA